MNKYLGLFLCILLLMGACKREAVPTVSRQELKELAIKEINFKYLSTRSKINFDDGERRIGATANIRIKKDSIIWFSVTPGFGIEAARGLVTQDSLFLINKLEKNYYAYSFPELSQKLNVNLSYNVFQAALLGDMLKPVSRRDKIDRQEGQVLIIQDEPQFNILNYISKETLKLDRVILQDKASTNALTLNYGDFKPLGGNVLPYSSTISAQHRNKQDLKTTTVAFKHNKAEFSDSPLSFPFDIPDKYDRKK